MEVSEQVLAKHGKALTKEAHAAALGKRPLDCWRDVAAILELAVPAEQLFNETEPLLQARWAMGQASTATVGTLGGRRLAFAAHKVLYLRLFITAISLVWKLW